MGVIIGSVGNLLKISQKNTQNEKTVDPVYGMDVTVETTNQIEYKGKSYYFCSPHCARIFADEPTKYLIDSDLSLRSIVTKIKDIFR